MDFLLIFPFSSSLHRPLNPNADHPVPIDAPVLKTRNGSGVKLTLTSGRTVTGHSSKAVFILTFESFKRKCLPSGAGILHSALKVVFNSKLLNKPVIGAKWSPPET